MSKGFRDPATNHKLFAVKNQLNISKTQFTMASQFGSEDPAKTLVVRQVTPNIMTLSLPFHRGSVAKIGARATVARLASGRLAVFSPITLTDQVKQQVAEFGQVKYLVAPDAEHHMRLHDWHQHFKDTLVVGPDCLPAKRAKSKYPDTPFAGLISRSDNRTSKGTIDDEFDQEFDYEYFPEHPNREIAFLFKRERTLIEADLLFNLPAHEQFEKSSDKADTGLLTKIFTMLVGGGAGDAMGQRRLLWHVFSSKNRPAFNESVKVIQGWDFDRLIPCHGELVEPDAVITDGRGKELGRGGKVFFEKIMAWHLAAAKPKTT